MRLGTTYICVHDMDASLQFYTALLQRAPAYANDDRWVTFDCGNFLSLYNRKYDEALLKKKDKIRFNDAYLNDFLQQDTEKKNNLIILNFEVENLLEEYDRVRALGIGAVSELLYVNVHSPYWYFNVIDPDGNTVEITGKWT